MTGAAAYPAPVRLNLPSPRVVLRAVVVVALGAGLWAASTVRPHASTGCPMIMAAPPGGHTVCHCPHCPGGALCCCRH